MTTGPAGAGPGPGLCRGPGARLRPAPPRSGCRRGWGPRHAGDRPTALTGSGPAQGPGARGPPPPLSPARILRVSPTYSDPHWAGGRGSLRLRVARFMRPVPGPGPVHEARPGPGPGSLPDRGRPGSVPDRARTGCGPARVCRPQPRPARAGGARRGATAAPIRMAKQGGRASVWQHRRAGRPSAHTTTVSSGRAGRLERLGKAA
jgi:hypothetical protein